MLHPTQQSFVWRGSEKSYHIPGNEESSLCSLLLDHSHSSTPTGPYPANLFLFLYIFLTATSHQLE